MDLQAGFSRKAKNKGLCDQAETLTNVKNGVLWLFL